MIAGANEISDFLPQGKSIIMIDALIGYTEKTVCTTAHLQTNGLFIEHGKLTPEGMIENMAQTAIMGAYKLQKKHNKPLRAFLGGIGKLTVLGEVMAGQTIETEVKQTTQLGNLFLVEGRISMNNTPIAFCELKIMIDQ